MSVLLNIGSALVDGTEYQNSAALTIAITANASGNPRIDTIVLRKVFATQTVRAFVNTGTPAASPTPPALTQSAGVTWEIPIADIAVANGAVSITNANITSRAIFVNAADRVALDSLLNNSGTTLQTGDLVTLDSSADRAVSNTAGSLLLALKRVGIWNGRTAAAGIGRANSSGICRVQTNAAVTRGQHCNINPTVATCSGSTQPTIYTIGVFLETTSAPGLALAWIDVGIAAQFGFLGTTTLAAPTAQISLLINTLQGPYASWEVEFCLRTTLAATNDNVLMGLGTGGGATYYSYALLTTNSTPASAATQNLNATAAIIFNVPANNAPANVFAVGRMTFSHILGGAEVHISGHYAYRVANTNGSLGVGHIAGWFTRTGGINGIGITSSSAANMATGSYINIFAKQTT